MTHPDLPAFVRARGAERAQRWAAVVADEPDGSNDEMTATMRSEG